ncbi:hypothetical protein [Bacillus cereus]|uniref:DUF2726 domain-containing protein n=1 Tax=Bacillus cereus VD184 TaxID=1053242 RepID=A0A9W5RBX6_BACCE|nr:hypothetical protein [Bacillus cereus]EOQ19750.1 hypothetical protein IKC_04224 [Bacillus cereus VD184]
MSYTESQWLYFHDKFITKVKMINGNRCMVISRFKGKSREITFTCTKCSREYTLLASTLLKPWFCKHCSSKKERSIIHKSRMEMERKQALYEFHKRVEGVFSIVATKSDNLFLLRCMKCDSTKWYRVTSFLKLNQPCSQCRSLRQSRGSREIIGFLKKMDIEFKTEVTFNGCKNKNKLPFDFGVYKNDKLICLIEYDGEQHFKEIEFFGGKEGYLNRVTNDQIKDSFCKNKGIPLIRIDYRNKNIIEKLMMKLMPLLED